jgi:hypothetical protein
MTTTVNGVGYQDDVLSKPLNDDLSGLASAVNDLQSQFDAISTPASGSEVVNARDYHASLRDRIRSGGKVTENIKITGFTVSESSPADMNINVADGEAIVSGVGIDRTSISPIAITAPTTNDRIDIVVVNSDNTISVLSGAEAAIPEWPTIATSQLPIARIDLTTSTTSITNSDITNLSAERYETGWINRSDWTNVHLGSDTTKDTDSNIIHNLNKDITRLNVKVFISETGSFSDCFKMPTGAAQWDTVTEDRGTTIYQVDKNTLTLQTALNGIVWTKSDGTSDLLRAQDWYYKIYVSVD